jgi:hypothetical protein
VARCPIFPDGIRLAMINESVSVAELLPEFGSVIPAGRLTVAALLKGPVGDATTIAFTV